MTEKQKMLMDSVIVTLNSLTVSGADNMSKVLGCINALNNVLDLEGENGGQTDKGT